MADATKKLKTPEQIKEEFRRTGKTLAEWARENNFDYPIVLGVMNGQMKGHFGKAHKVAVALGMKEAA